MSRISSRKLVSWVGAAGTVMWWLFLLSDLLFDERSRSVSFGELLVSVPLLFIGVPLLVLLAVALVTTLVRWALRAFPD